VKCLMWRQHRGQLLWTAAVLVALAIAMVLAAHSADAWLSDYHAWQQQLRAAGCPVPGGGVPVSAPKSCHDLLAKYSDGAQPAFAQAYNFAILVFEEGVPLLLVLLGVLIGAPLVAREVEQRTQLVAWTQSVTRRRWYATKTGILAAGIVITGLIAGIANDRLQIPLTTGGLSQSRWPWFFSIDVTPAAEALLAFALAVALGAWLGRTLVAIAAALTTWLLLFVMSVLVLRNATPLRHAAGDRGVPDDAWHLGGNQYHPASQYWPLQTTFTVAIVLIAALLLWSGWRATRTRDL
jgi:hypothetical protein